MKRILLISMLLVHFGIKTNAQTTLFTQDFINGGVYTDYVDPTADNKFTNIVSGNATNAAISITNNALRLVKTGAFNGGANTFYALRSSGFGTNNVDLVQFKFDYTVSNITTISTTGTPNYHLLVGSSVTNDAFVANYHSKVTITHSSTTLGSWFIAGSSGTLYSGTQTITLIANNSGVSKSYIAPDGSTATVANDTYDIWVGNTLEINDLPALNTGDTLSKFKFDLPANTLAATFDIDNVIVTSLPLILPITLTSFTPKAVDQTILLNWQTASEKDNAYFEVLRSADGKNYTTISPKITGAGTSNNINNYSFVDENPYAGVSYYKLAQYDLDGTVSYSEVKSVTSKVAQAQLSVYATTADVKVSIFSPNQTKGVLQLFDISGRKLVEQNISANKGFNSINLPMSLNSGVHFVRYNADGININQKFIK
ncbi:T9SS type A sorting domain-containing protein [Pelobium sp.]|nr:T9SS type A sorting domain-containing protein [Pelobium sp.]MDA9554781.1 T9SS type A sorting domain-containing protein [Pelobium sp.]